MLSINLTMKTKPCLPITVSTLLLTFAATAQTTWNNGGGDNNWNNSLNWDNGVPVEFTDAIIPAGGLANYNSPMTATSFGRLFNSGTVNVNASGFNLDGGGDGVVNAVGSAARLFFNAGAVVNIPSGGLSLSNAASLTVAPGASVNIGTFFLLGRNGTGNTGLATNDGGTITAANTSVNPNNNSSTSLLLIRGGTNDLGNVVVKRSAAAAPAPGLGTEGLVISNGLVRMTSLDLGGSDGNSWLTMLQTGGTVTNSGDFIMRQVTASRASRFVQLGGRFVQNGPNAINLRGHSANNSFVFYSVLGGTNVITGIAFGTPGGTDTTGSIRVTNAARLHLGSAGITATGTHAARTIALTGGALGAEADWTSTESLLLAGGAIDCADLAGNPHNITLSAPLTGAGPLLKQGGGTLNLEAANTHSGPTFVRAGTLTLGPSGTLNTSPLLFVHTNATLNVSAVSGGFTHAATRVLAGWGTVNGNVTLASGAIIDPGTNGAPGTLTLNNDLILSGGGVLRFDLPVTPGPGNDKLVVGDDLIVSGVNTIEVTGGGPPGTTHALLQYQNTFTGSLASFNVIGVSGTLSNDVSGKTIYLTITSAIRGPTNVVWVGNPVVNEWDLANRTNWLNAGVLDYFVTGDAVRFDAAGAANPNVVIPVTVSPGSVTVDATTDYTWSGAGTISGIGGLTKTNSGTLTINLNNGFTGPVAIHGGTVSIASLLDGGANSPLGASSAASANLTLNNGTLRYTGGTTTTDRGATLGAGGGTLEVTTASSTLTLNGVLTGAGALAKTGPGTLSLGGVNDYAGGTRNSNGTLRVTATANLGTGILTNQNANLLIGSATTIGTTLRFEGNCVVDLNNVGGNTALNGAWTGDGYVLITNQQNDTRVFTIGGNGTGGGNLTGFSGTVDMGNCPGTLRFNDGGGTGSGPNFGSASAAFNLGSSTALFIVRNGGTINSLGELRGGPNTRLSGRGSSAGNVTWRIGGRNTDATFEGTIQDTDTPGGQLTLIVKEGSGKWTLTGNSTHTGSTTVEAGTLEVNGSLGNTTVTVTGGTLAGNGTFAGQVNIQPGGTLAPGSSLGALTINNTLDLGGNVLIEVSKGVGNDSVTANAINYGGTLVLTNIGTALAAGDSFTLFNTPAPTGNFTAIAGSPGAGLEWSFDPLTGVATVIPASAPPTLNFTRTGSSLEFSWTGSFKLQAQTNSRATGLGTNWADYPGGGTSPVTVPMNPANEAVFFRLISTP